MEGDQENKIGQETFSITRTSQGNWARSNVENSHAFAEPLANVFQPHPSENKPEEEEALIQLLETNWNHQSTVSKS
jgi:hypothetical protein